MLANCWSAEILNYIKCTCGLKMRKNKEKVEKRDTSEF